MRSKLAVLRAPVGAAILAGLVSVPGLPGQTEGEASATAAAARPWFSVRIADRARLRAVFLPTTIGSLLTDERGEPMLAQSEELVRHAFEPLGLPGGSVARLVAAVKEFDGGLELRLWLDSDPSIPRRRQRWRLDLAGFIRWHGGSPEQRKAIAEAWNEALGRSDATAERTEIGEREIKSYRVGAIGQRVSEAGPHAGALVALVGRPAVASGLLADAAPPEPLTTAPIAIDFELATTISRFAGQSFLKGATLRELGMFSLRRLRIEIGASGPDVVTEFAVRFDEGDRGLFEGLFPAVVGPPKVPAGVRNTDRDWIATRLDPSLVVDAFMDALEVEFGGREHLLSDADDIERLAKALDDSCVVIGDPGAALIGFGSKAGVLGFRIRDPEQCRAAADVVLGSHRTVAEDGIDRTWRHGRDNRIRQVGGWFLRSYRRESEVDRSLFETGPPSELVDPKAVETVPGQHGIGRIRLESAWSLLGWLPAAGGWSSGATNRGVERLLEALDREGLGSARLAAGFKDRVYRIQLRW